MLYHNGKDIRVTTGKHTYEITHAEGSPLGKRTFKFETVEGEYFGFEGVVTRNRVPASQNPHRGARLR